MAKYTYNSVDPRVFPFKKTVRFTRGEFAGWTPPMGIVNARYAIFRNKATELLIPVYDLTKETKERINALHTTNYAGVEKARMEGELWVN
ncbi:MAG: hypothetical protein Q7U76_12980 [Nitrospirota bacterium]|nr:hypothetical protein [Nitrospirota bacterium]